ncbi:MAG: hypothetical protein IPJ33_15890 [Gammaproteobacteria bacterium]|nr:hypothetical protein [Gammaproteobacteria bacterium]
MTAEDDLICGKLYMRISQTHLDDIGSYYVVSFHVHLGIRGAGTSTTDKPAAVVRKINL